ncbi:MAG: aminotransferase class I/II-fold pyridoxal phosphate-dependent enzyme [Anaerolineae bacterium]
MNVEELASRRPWVGSEVDTFIQENTARYLTMSPAELDTELERLVNTHERYMDHECVQLYAGTNIVNPRVGRMLSSTLGSRASLGYPGAKYNMGMQYGDQIEIMLSALLKKLFDAPYAEYRVPSGTISNLYVYMATTKPGDKIMAFSDAAAGHVSHHVAGAAGLYGLDIHEAPFDVARMDIDAAAFVAKARALRPKLIIVAGSMCLFPYSLEVVRQVADEIGAWVLYDAAHMGGLIAGGHFQQPLHEGAHVMTGSTYKSFGGPPSGMILTTSAELADRIERVAYPGMTANFDLSKAAAMIVAVLDLAEFGPQYGAACIANAQALAEALHEFGVTVHHVEGRGFTASQHVAVQALAYGGGNRASALLSGANLLMSSITLPIAELPDDANAIRIGTQEVTRWGMEPADMRTVAQFMARVLVQGEDPARVKPGVVDFRAQFQDLHYVRC